MLYNVQKIMKLQKKNMKQEKKRMEWKQEEINNQINELKEAKIKEEETKKIAEEKALEAEAKAKLASANENDPNKSPEQQINKSNSIDHGESIEALEKQLTEWNEEPVKLQDYNKEEKNIYMCLLRYSGTR